MEQYFAGKSFCSASGQLASTYYSRYLPCLLATLLFLSSALQAANFNSADGYYEDALRHYQRKDFVTAIIQLKNALQLDDNHLPAKILLGESYLGSGEAQAAEVQLRRARQQGADENLVAVPIANSLLSQEKYQQLEEYISRARRLPAVDARLLVILGIAFTQQQLYIKADESFSRAHELDPGNPEPLLAQASMALNNEQLDKAERLLSQARDLAADNTELLLLQGDLYARQHKAELALQAYNKILEINPDYVTATVRRARILLEQQQYAIVIADLKPLWEQELYDPEAIYLYSTALARSGETARATEILEQASRKIDYLGASLVDKHPSLALLSASIAYQQGEILKALEITQGLVRKLPNHAASLLLLGRIYLDLEQPEEAIKHLKPMLDRQQNNAEFLALYGRALMQVHKYREALSALERAASLSPDPDQLLTDISLARIASGDTGTALEALQLAVKQGKFETKSAILLAYTQLASGKVQEAEQTAAELLRQQPESAVVHNLLGTLAAGKSEFEQARKHFQLALKFEPAYVPARMNLAKFDMKDGKLADAEKHLQQVLQDDPESREAMAGLAQLAELKNDYASSAQWLEKLWLKNPQVQMEILHLIEVYQRLGDRDRALAVAQQLRDRHPKSFEVLLALVDAQLAAGKRQDAIDALNQSLRYTVDFSLQQLLEIAKQQLRVEDINGAYSTISKCLLQDPDFAPAKIEMIRLETRLRNYDKALQLADELIHSQPDSALGHSLKGDILVFANRQNEALAVYKKVNKIWPSTQLHLKILQLSLRQSEATEALASLEQWLQKHPQDAQARYGLAIAYIDVGEYDKSIALHRALLEQLPEDASIHNNLAWLLQNKNDSRALQYAKKAYQLRPQDPAVLDTYGWILSENGDSEAGLRYIRQALSRNAAEPSAQYHLALVLSRLARADEAIKTLQKLLQTKTTFRELDKARKLLQALEKQN